MMEQLIKNNFKLKSLDNILDNKNCLFNEISFL